jgi:glycosyltransferase involved in cell wall biosynthesis
MNSRPRRILQVVEASFAGVGRHAVDLTAGLRARGHDVHLIYSPCRTDARFTAAVKSFANPPGRVPTMAIPIRRSPHPSDCEVMRALRAYMRRQGPFDIVHAHSTKAGIVARVGTLGMGAVRVYTPNAPASSDPTLHQLQRCLIGTLERGLGLVSDAVLVVSTEELEHVRGLGLHEKRLFLVPNGIAISPAPATRELKAKLRQEIGVAPDDIVIGTVGRLSVQKDTGTLLRAFASIVPKLSSGVRLVIVGDGQFGGKLRALGQSLGLGSRVLWLGPRDGPRTMPVFDIFALSSLYEGLPYVVLEAMNEALPIISTQVGGCGLLIENGRNGWTVPVGRADLFGEALLPLIRDARLRVQMGLASRARVPAFSVETMVAKTEAVYQSVIDARAAASVRSASEPHHST